MDDRLQRLSDKAKCLPKAPGVYLMKDDKGRVIYVGKSASLRDRVASYFQPATKLESKKDYAKDVSRLLRFLEGNHKQVMRELEKEMIEASKDQQFERAAKLRDEIKALQGLNARAKKGEQEYWQPEAFISDPKEGVVA